MNRIILCFSVFCLFACGNQSQDGNSKNELTSSEKEEISEKAPPNESEVENELISEPDTESVLGYYVGDFEASKYRENRRPSYINKINISIDRIVGDSLYGHSVVAGNDRPFKGTVDRMADGHFEVVVVEPGDDRYDGIFKFSIYPNQNRIAGSWDANNKNLAVYQRVFDLEKRSFNYDPNLELPEDVGWAELYDSNASEEFVEEGEYLTEDVLKLNPSQRLLKKEEVENLYKGDLEVIRHSIYARHGYSFKNRKARFIFDQYVDWYIPVSTDIRAELTSVEKQNIDLLKRYEQHADRYYDVFGR